MFNVGGMEILVIAIVALIVLGPEKLPGAMRQVGSTLGELRRMSQGLQTDLRSALDEAERDAERQRLAAERANDAGAPPTNEVAGTAPDPGAAMAAAQAELDAIQAATDQDDGDDGDDADDDEGTDPRPAAEPGA